MQSLCINMNLSINEQLQLKDITIEDQQPLMALMQSIYPPVYEHLWKENSDWYLDKIYGVANLTKELEETDSTYCFVIYKQQTVGILRALFKKNLPGLDSPKAAQLQKLYLLPLHIVHKCQPFYFSLITFITFNSILAMIIINPMQHFAEYLAYFTVCISLYLLTNTARYSFIFITANQYIKELVDGKQNSPTISRS